MDIILDGKILAEFKRKAKENFEQEQKDGRLVQLLCYFIGRTYIYENGTKQLIDGIIYPKQTCYATNVIDNGIGEQNTIEWLKQNYPDKTLIAWVHSTAQGTPGVCEYSANDVHKHFTLQKSISSNIIGIVVKLEPTFQVWDAFTLTKIGKEKTSTCNEKHQFNDSLCCSMPLEQLYESCKNDIDIITTSVTFGCLDFRFKHGKHQANSKQENENKKITPVSQNFAFDSEETHVTKNNSRKRISEDNESYQGKLFKFFKQN
jgi:hypothetical protein